jgi:CPA2 family monovalent cation:H+ antiporter-2
VIVGYGRVGRHIVEVLERLRVPSLVIESDADRVAQLDLRGVPTLFGDAANSEVLNHAGLDRARALVVTLPDEAAAEMTVAAGRALAPDLRIIARAASESGVKRLAQLGAQDVIHPELEGGLEVVRHTLLHLGFPLREVHQYAEAVRRDHYDVAVSSAEEHRLLHQLVDASGSIEITWLQLSKGNLLVGQTLAEANIRARTGASVVAILRNGHMMPNPKSMTILQAEDRLGLIGEKEQIEVAEKLLTAAGLQQPIDIPSSQSSPNR